MKMTAELEFCHEAFGGINRDGKPRFIFTKERVNSRWPEYPFVADAVIMENSYDNTGKKMMAAGEECLVFYNSSGQTITLPKAEWPENISDPGQLTSLVKTLSEDPEIGKQAKSQRR